MNTLFDQLTAASQNEGFDLTGALDFAELSTSKSQKWNEHLSYFKTWIENQYHGEMNYMERGAERRARLDLVFPEVQSVFCVSFPYSAAPLEPNPKSPQLARYTRGGDYHDIMPAALERALKRVKEQHAPSLRWKICVDTSSVLERTLCELGGLGWIGKNTLLINKNRGSYFLLGVVLLNVPLHAIQVPQINLCGHCNRCLEACPTEALVAPGVLDARKCISYWTLEKRGDLKLNTEEHKALGTWVAGCDICQEVCPFNMKAARHLPEIHPETATLETMTKKVWERYMSLDTSPVPRIKPAEWKRNLLLARRNATHHDT